MDGSPGEVSPQGLPLLAWPYLQHVHLHAAHHADHLAVPPAGLPGLEGRVPDVGAEADHTAQKGEARHLGAQHIGRAEAGGVCRAEPQEQ